MDVSIFEYLTVENPRIISSGKPKADTSKPYFFRPMQLRLWEEFNMDNLKEIYGNALMKEAHKKRRPFHRPELEEHECQVHDHETTLNVLGQWSIFMTKAALQAVRNELHPAIWSAETRQRKEPEDKPLKKKPLVPDWSAISLCKVCQVTDKDSPWKTRERLPKEVKPYPKFDSGRVWPRLTDEGYWDMLQKNKGEESAIRQAYTYCVNSGCRYGCILSAYEAFIFRIRPLHRPEGLNNVGKDEERIAMKNILIDQGLMEYVTVPWDNHKPSGSTAEFNDLTVNFSLWVLHILAGNAHEIDWAYKPLLEETLVEQPCTPLIIPESETPATVDNSETAQVTPVTPRTPSVIETSSRKRSRKTRATDVTSSFRQDETIPTQKQASPPLYVDDGSTTEEDDNIFLRNYAAAQEDNPPSRNELHESNRRVTRTQARAQVATGRKRARGPRARSTVRDPVGCQRDYQQDRP